MLSTNDDQVGQTFCEPGYEKYVQPNIGRQFAQYVVFAVQFWHRGAP